MNAEEAKLDHWNSVARAYGLPDYSYAVQSGDVDLLRNINARIRLERAAFEHTDAIHKPIVVAAAERGKTAKYFDQSLFKNTQSASAGQTIITPSMRLAQLRDDSAESWRIQKQDVYERLKLNFTIDWLQRQGSPRHLLIADRLKEIICT